MDCQNKIDDDRLKKLDCFQQKIGVKFKDIKLLDTALTHASYSREFEPRLPDNEKLEFLGDAVLELASSTYLYKKYEDFSEGELTKTRACIVCQASLSELARKIGIGDLLLLSHGEDMSGGRERPSILEDAFEAVIGAIYLDQGWRTVSNYVFGQLAPVLENIENVETVKNYKSTLQEMIQRESNGSKIAYIELNVEGPDHMREFECAVSIDDKIYGRGKGRNKKSAEQMAAKEALEIIESEFLR